MKMKISDKELYEYLRITQKILSVSKSEYETERLQEIVESLKNDRYEIVHEESQVKLASKKDIQLVIDYIKKTHNHETPTQNEIDMFDTYCNSNRYLKLITMKSYNELYELLSSDIKIQKKDINLIYLYLTGNEGKSVKLENMIDDIKSYLFKLDNFQDMDFRFGNFEKPVEKAVKKK